METTLMVLPPEVEELAVKVSAEKQAEVSTVLTQIFTGTNDWKQQADSIVVKDINDKMSIQLADVGRKNVKNARLAAEKIFDAKREEVQQKKSEFDLEDKLWLKAKQTMQLLFRDVESTFEYKAKFAERFEAEQKELRTQSRIEKVLKFNPELNRIEFENMSEEMFGIFISGLEKDFNDKKDAEVKAEQERLAKIKADNDERERIRKENERLKKENEEKEKKLQAERKAAEAEVERQAKIQAALKANADAERKLLEDKARKERERAEIKLKAERETAAKLQAELDAKRKAESDAKAKAEAEEKARIAAEKKMERQPDKIKLATISKSIDRMCIELPITNLKSEEAKKILSEAIELLMKASKYINEKSEIL